MYSKRVSEERGLTHQIVLRSLRYYIKTHTEEELVKELEGITEARSLRAIWEAGVSQVLQDAVLAQLEKIK